MDRSSSVIDSHRRERTLWRRLRTPPRHRPRPAAPRFAKEMAGTSPAMTMRRVAWAPAIPSRLLRQTRSRDRLLKQVSHGGRNVLIGAHLGEQPGRGAVLHVGGDLR